MNGPQKEDESTNVRIEKKTSSKSSNPEIKITRHSLYETIIYQIKYTAFEVKKFRFIFPYTHQALLLHIPQVES